MESLRELYKVGSGPSSSHTIAPQRAMTLFLNHFPQTDCFEVELYGSLSLTGKGHFSDQAIIQSVAPIECKVSFLLDWEYDFPNGLLIKGYQQQELLDKWVVYSLGGGSIKVLNHDFDFQKSIYPHTLMDDIITYCQKHNLSFHEYVSRFEPNLQGYLSNILDSMIDSVKRGLNKEGNLPGKLNIQRIASSLNNKIKPNLPLDQMYRLKLASYAYAVMEENASLGEVVTAPTCGSAGILASIMYHYLTDLKYDREKLIEALATAGLFGNVVKKNATISGAEGGCQAEVGVGCAMAAAAVSALEGGSLETIEYAAEIGIEHHLGLTCDPVGGYVMIPCIERNAVAAQRAKDAAFMAQTLGEIKKNLVSFDMVVSTMKYTGSKIAIELRETSLGGLAQIINIKD